MEVALGAIIAVASGALTDWLRAWIDRNRRIEVRRSDFQHRTAIELQEELFDLMRSSAKILIADATAYHKSKQWGQNLVSEELAELYRVQIARARILLERLDSDELRSDVEELLTLAASTAMTPSKAEAEKRHSALMDRFEVTNKSIGKWIRDSWAD